MGKKSDDFQGAARKSGGRSFALTFGYQKEVAIDSAIQNRSI
jgi:hypothetical protein